MSFLLLILCLGAYLVGALPTGYLLCKYLWGVDITQHGSGNIGASNVARVLGRRYFLIIFLLDAAKAYVAVTVGQLLVPDTGYMLAAAVLLGNAYSVFLGFRGGKGVASSVGIMAAILTWPLVVCFMVLWCIVLGLTRQPFIASLGALSGLFVGNLLFGCPTSTLFLFILGAWLVFRHAANLRACW